jgi:quinoprotein glucose dehydrogenase
MRLIITVFFIFLLACNQSASNEAGVSSASLSQGTGSAASIAHTTWTQYGGGADQSKYVVFNQINKSNLNELDIAWSYPTEDNAAYRYNPIIVDSVMYVLAKNNSLVAINLRTQKEIWIHANLNTMSKKGINYWESKDKKDKRIIFCTNNTLQALDAATGKSITSFGTNGYVNLKEGLDRAEATVFRSAPSTPGQIFEDRIILGVSPGEALFTAPGHIRAFNVITGKREWIFHTVPHPGEFGYDTWPKDAYKYVGGTNCWGEMSVDEKRAIVYIPIGSPTYDYYGGDREGTGLFGNCILALDARTGKRLWHFQTVHHDIWDFDLSAAPQLITVNHDGKQVDAVAQASKQGFLYVLNRETGEPLWPIEERPVPKSNMPGEKSWPTQPFPTVVPPFSRQALTADDINPYFTNEQKEIWKKRIALTKTGLFQPLSDQYEVITMPGANGGAIYGNTASNPSKGLMYIITMDKPSVYRLKKEDPQELNLPLAGKDSAQISAVYTQYCQTCHGANKEGGTGPVLKDINTRVNFDIFQAVVTGGKGLMPSFLHIGEQNILNLYKYLSGQRRRGGFPFGQQGEIPAPSGPVVATGGVPIPDSLKSMPFSRNILSKNYPEGIEPPAVRYVDGSTTSYGLGYPDLIGPPWSSIVAYDLNTGAIKWKRALGTVDSLGKDLGIPIGSQGKGMVVTQSGIIFSTCLDGSVYAYDEDNGNILWSYKFQRVPEGIPAMFQLDGKQYLVVCVTGPLVDKTKKESDVPREYAMFSLKNN